jgi:hypothetical protein
MWVSLLCSRDENVCLVDFGRKELKIKFGTNDFFGVPFPLVLADRFFHMYEDLQGKMTLDVFRWDDEKQEPFYEVEASKPIEENIETNPTGIITFGEADGGFLFKFRPRPGVSQIFGRVPIKDELHAHINDHKLHVMRGDQSIVTLERNQFTGFAIGVKVEADGSVGIATNALPAGMQLQRGA